MMYGQGRQQRPFYLALAVYASSAKSMTLAGVGEKSAKIRHFEKCSRNLRLPCIH